MFVESCSHSEFVSAPMPMVAMASPAVDVPHPPHPHPRGHQHKGQRLQTKLAPQGPGGAPSFELVISRALRLWKKREGKALVLQGLCGVTPQLSPRCWHCPPSQSMGQLGKKLGGSGGWQKINHSSWVLTLCPNWFPQTKLHCPLTRTNKLSRERPKVTGDPKYLPWYLIRVRTTLLLCSHWQNVKSKNQIKKQNKKLSKMFGAFD